ncbi:hypothetical protein D3C80_788430 [compost metagenome]
MKIMLAVACGLCNIEIPEDAFSYVEPSQAKRVKGISEDAVKSLLDSELARASDATSKQQHTDHKKDGALQKKVKTAQDAKMKKQQGLRAMQAQLVALNGKRPTDPKKIQDWTKRRRALAERITEKRNSIRLSDSRVAGMRKEVREN